MSNESNLLNESESKLVSSYAQAIREKSLVADDVNINNNNNNNNNNNKTQKQSAIRSIYNRRLNRSRKSLSSKITSSNGSFIANTTPTITNIVTTYPYRNVDIDTSNNADTINTNRNSHNQFQDDTDKDTGARVVAAATAGKLSEKVIIDNNMSQSEEILRIPVIPTINDDLLVVTDMTTNEQMNIADEESFFIGQQPMNNANDTETKQSDDQDTVQQKEQFHPSEATATSTITSTSTSIVTPTILNKLQSLREWLPIATTAAQEEKEETRFHYHSDKLDEILNDVPTRFIENADKGLLSILLRRPSENNRSLLSAEEKYRDLLQYQALKTSGGTGNNDWDLLHRVILGRNDNEGGVNYDQTDDTSKSNDNMMSFPLTQDDIDIDIDFDLGYNHNNHPTKTSTMQKDTKIQYPEAAWWVKEIKSRGWLDDYDTNNFELGSSWDDNNEEGNKHHISSSPTKDDTLESLLTDEKFVNNVELDNDELDIDNNDDKDNQDNDVIDWKECLWSTAREHYNKAFVNSNDEADVSKFRSLLERCLIVYVGIFHSKVCEDSSNRKLNNEICPEIMTMLNIPEHVPISLVSCLFERVIEDSFDDIILHGNHDDSIEEEEGEGEYKANIETDEVNDKNTIKHAIMNAFLDHRTGIFSRYKVEIVDISANILHENEKKINIEEGDEDDAHQSLGLPKRFTRKLVEVNVNDDRREIERFLYGKDISHTLSAEDESGNDQSNKKSIKEKNKNEAYQNEDEEVRLESSLILFLQERDQSCHSMGKWILLFTSILLESLGMQKSITWLRSKLTSKEKSSILIPPSEYEPSLSVVYALQYVNKMLLRSHIFYDKNDDSTLSFARCMKDSDGKDETTSPSQLIFDLILDSNLLRRRISALGAFLSVKEYVIEWKCLRYVQKNHLESSTNDNYDDRLYSVESERQSYHIFFNHIISILGKILTELIEHGEEGSKKETKVSNDKVKHLEELFEDNDKKTKISVREYLHVSLCCIDIGRCCYNFGIDLGKNEKEFFEEETKLEIEAIHKMEASAYDLAIKALRQSSDSLLSCKGDHDDTQPESQQKDMYDLNVSSDLYLADCLVAAGFCYDTKFSEHEKAISSYREALSLYRHFGNYHVSVSNALQNLGSIYYTIKNWDEALRCYKHRLTILLRLLDNKDDMQYGVSKFVLNREKAHTLQCIAKSSAEHSVNNDAIKYYEQAIIQFRAINKGTNDFKIDIESNEDISDCLSEVSKIYLKQSANIEATWHNQSIRKISEGMMDVKHKSTDHLFRVAGLEKKAYMSLDESITIRSELRKEEESAWIIELSSYEKEKFVEDLTLLGVLHFREQIYNQAAEYFEQAWKILTSNTCEGQLDLDNFSIHMLEDGLLELHSTNLLPKYQILTPLLFFMGNVSVRLMKYDHAMSCFNLLIRICELQLSSPPPSSQSIEKKGIQLDMAKIRRSIGFVHFKTGNLKVSTSQLRSSLRLLDGAVSECETQDFDRIKEEDLLTSIEKLATCAKQDFSIQLHARISIGNLLNILGRVYEIKEETKSKALTCFEDSMLILDRIVEEIKQNPDLIFDSSPTIQGSLIKCSISSFTLISTLADSYHRAGKIYLVRGMLVDSAMAFERAIEILEDLHGESVRDDETNYEFISSIKSDNHLLELYDLLLDLVTDKDETKSKDLLRPETHETDDEFHFTAEDLQLRIGNHYARIRYFSSALKSYQLAEELTEKRLETRDHSIVANIVHNIGMMQKELISSNASLANDAELSFKEAITISNKAFGDNHVLITESLVQLADLIMKNEDWETFRHGESSSREKEVQIYLENALKIRCELYGGSDINVARTLLVMGKFYLNTWQTDRAVDTLNKALSIYKKIDGYYAEWSEVLFILGVVHMRAAELVSNKFGNKCIELLDKALSYFEDNLNSKRQLRIREHFDQNNQFLLMTIKSMFHATSIHQTKDQPLEAMRYVSKLFTFLSNILSHDFLNEDQKYIIQKKRICNHWMALTWFKSGFLQEVSGNIVGAMRCFNKSIKVASNGTSDDSCQFESDAHNQITKVKLAKMWYKYYNDCDNASRLLLESLHSMKVAYGSSSPEVAAVLFYLGETNTQNNEKAMEYYMQALHILNMKRKLPCIYLAIKGLIHYEIAKFCCQMDDMTNAYVHIHKAVSLIEDYQPKAKISGINSASGHPRDTFQNMLSSVEDWNTRLVQCYSTSLNIMCVWPDSFNAQHAAVDIIYKVGMICRRVGKMDEAFQCHYSVLLYNQALQDNDGRVIAKSLLHLAKIYINWDEYGSSLPCVEECYLISSFPNEKETKTLELIDHIDLSSDLCFKLNRLKEAEMWSDRGLDLLNKCDRKSEMVKFLIMKADIHYEMENYDDVSQILEEALTRCREVFQSEDKREFGNIFVSFGNINAKKRNFERAVKDYYNSLRVRESLNDEAGVASVKNKVGDMFMSFGGTETKRARAFYSESLCTRTASFGSDSQVIAISLVNIGKLLVKYEPTELGLAEKFLCEAIRICHLHNDYYRLATCFYLFGVLREQSFSVEAALRYYLDAIKILDEHNTRYKDLQITLLHNIGSIYSTRSEYRIAVDYLKRSIEFESKSLNSCHEVTAKSFYLLGNAELFLNELDSSAVNLKSASKLLLKTNRKKSLLMLRCLLRLGKIYVCRRENPLAIGYLSEALVLWKQLKTSVASSRDILMSFGELYIELEDLDKAEEYFEEGLLVDTDRNDIIFSSTLHMHLAMVKYKKEDLTMSKYHAHLAMSLYKTSCGEQSAEYAMILEKIGDIESSANEKSKAMEYYNEALLIREGKHDEENTTRLLLLIGSCHLSLGHHQNSLIFFQELVKRTTNLKNKSYDIESRAKQGLAYAFFSMCDYDNSLKIYTNIISHHTYLNLLSPPEIISIHRCLGYIYLRKGLKEKVYHHFMLSIAAYEEYSSLSRESPDLTDESITKNILGVYEEVISILEKDSECKERITSIRYGYTIALVEIGYIKKAFDLLQEVLTHQESLSDNESSLAATLHNLGNCNTILENNVIDSITFYERSLRISTRIYGENAEENSDTMLSLAEAHVTNSNFAKALELGQKALRVKMRYKGAETIPIAVMLQRLGRILLSSGEIEGSLKALNDALNIQRKSFYTSDNRLSSNYFYIGKAYCSKKQYEKGLKFLKQVNFHCDEGCEALLEIAHIYTTRGETDLAIEQHNRCYDLVENRLKISSSTPLFLYETERDVTNNLNRANVLEQAIIFEADKCQHLPRFTKLLNVYGMLFKIAERYEEALTCFNFCLKIFRTNSIRASRTGDVLYERGVLFSKIGKHSCASESLKEALRIFRHIFRDIYNERLCETLKLLGECESKQDHVDDALELLQEVNYWWKINRKGQNSIRSDSHAIQGLLLQVGKLYQKKKDYNSALDNFGGSLEISQRIETKGLRGESVHAVGQLYFESGNYFRAMLNYQHAFDIFRERDEKNLNTIFSMGELYLEVGRYHDSLDCFTHCLDELEKKSYTNDNENDLLSQILKNMGAIYVNINEYENAKKVYYRAIELVDDIIGEYKDSTKCWRALAEIYYKEKRYEDALSCYHSAFQIVKNLPYSCRRDGIVADLLIQMGSCYLNIKDFENAVTNLSEALRIKMEQCADDFDGDKIVELRLKLGLGMYWSGKNDIALEQWKKVLHAKKISLPLNVSIKMILDCIEKFLQIVGEKSGTHKHLEYANILQKRGIYQAWQNDLHNAIFSHTESLKIYQGIHGSNHFDVANALFNIAVCMNSQGSPDQASKLLQKARSIIKNSMGDDSLDLVDILHQLGISYKLMNDLSEARNTLEGAIQIQKQHSQYQTLKSAQIIELIGDIATIKKSSSAEQCYSESLRIKSLYCQFSDLTLLLLKLSTLNKERGNYRKSIDIYEKCLIHRKIFVGERDMITSELYLKLGIAYECSNNPKKALICYDKSAKFIDVDNSATLKALSKKANLLLRCGHDKEAADCLKEAQSQDQGVLRGEFSALQGQVFERSNNFKMAMHYYNEAQSIFESERRSGSIIARVKVDKANLLFKVNRQKEARASLSEASSQSEGLIQAEAMLMQGQTFEYDSEYVQALQFYETALSVLLVFSKGKTADSYQIRSYNLLMAKTKYHMGCIQDLFRDFDDALKSLKESLFLSKKVLGGNDVTNATTMRKLGNIHSKRKEFKQASPFLKESIKIYSYQFGVDSIEVVQTLLDSAYVFHKLGKHYKVIYCCTEIIAVYEKKYAEGQDQNEFAAPLAKGYGLKAVTHDTLNETEAAIECFDKSIHIYNLCLDDVTTFENLDTEEKDNYMFYTSMIVRNAKLQERMGEDVIAMRHYRKAINLYKVLFGSEQNLLVADIFEYMANMHGRKKKYDKACVLLETTLNIRINILGMDHAKVAQALFSLGLLFDQIKQFDAAMKSFADCLEIQQITLGPTSIQYAETLAAVGQCFGNQGDFESALNLWNQVISIYKEQGYDSSHPKLLRLEQQHSLATKLLTKTKTKWDPFRSM